jgi:antagonist of KipI
MTKPLFQVEKTGLLTSYQDLGRKKNLSKGVVASGAMDTVSCQLANLLVGNSRDEACIEIAMQGPVFTVLAEKATIAICGADLSPTVNGEAAPCWKALEIHEGDRLSFGAPKEGVFAYIAVHGGYSAAAVLGSKSFYGKAGLGTEISKASAIMGADKPYCKPETNGIRPPFSYQKETTVRVILGPHHEDFTKESVSHFLNNPYQLGLADRMGCRLQGKSALELKESLQRSIDSDAIPFGGIQIPADGFPIVLLADRQTTGGYRRIGTVISADIPKIVQVPPGGTVRFKKVGLEEAYAALKEQQSFLKTLELMISN